MSWGNQTYRSRGGNPPIFRLFSGSQFEGFFIISIRGLWRVTNRIFLARERECVLKIEECHAISFFLELQLC